MRAARSLLLLLLSATGLSAQTQARSTLDIYYIDSEGGGSTLFVSPSGEAAMIDTGNPGARDLDRIVATLSEAGVRELAYLVSTHYHIDHIGGLQELAKRERLGRAGAVRERGSRAGRGLSCGNLALAGNQCEGFGGRAGHAQGDKNA